MDQRFVVMKADDVPAGALAEYGYESWCVKYADQHNRGNGFDPVCNPREDDGVTWDYAIVDTHSIPKTPAIEVAVSDVPERHVTFTFFDDPGGTFRFRASFNPPIPKGTPFDSLTPAQRAAYAAFGLIHEQILDSAEEIEKVEA